jgi:alginate O-acetyltransferase complex protein AlgI
MLFNSLQFVVYFIIVTFAYFLLPHKYRWVLLLAASCYFYMAFVPVYILILGFTIVIDYFAGILLEEKKGKARKFYLIASLCANIGVLAVFKYYNFFNHNVDKFYGLFEASTPLPYLSILLPIGLSFHTFQAMSYTIEVYRGNQKAERNFGIYSLYVMFYPQLVAGPIERPQNLLHQFYERHYYDFERIKSGLMMIAFGMFKKVVIADRISIAVDHIYGSAGSQNSLALVIATVLYAIQIYCDFSGYSEIAVGTARVMGFTLMDNFRAPYFSKSIAEFWKRWHISLSTWFKDYLYVPLGGNRVAIPRWFFNLFIVFVISGLWHGANWTFIIWGALHGVYLIAAIIKDKYFRGIKGKLDRFFFTPYLKILITFILVDFAWIFFRANSFSHAMEIIKGIFRFSFEGPMSLGLNNNELIFSFILIVILFLKEKFFLKIDTNNTKIFALVFSIVILACYLFGVFGQKQFIYFQF